jgi:exopolysaccharide biosynthesis polyprenyl glycosylphosphotransferase
MIKISRYFFIKLFYVAVDLVLAVTAIYGACWLRNSTVPFDALRLENIFFSPDNEYRQLFQFWPLIVIFLNQWHQLYETRRELIKSMEIRAVIRSVGLSTLIIIVGIYSLKITGFPRTIIFFSAVFMAGLLSLWRFIKRLVVQIMVARGYNNFNAVIVGAGKVGAALQREINQKKDLGIRVVGFLDDYKEGRAAPDLAPVIGKIADFRRVVRREFVNKVFITVHHDGEVFLDLLEQAKRLGVSVRVIPQGFDIIPGEFMKYNIGFIPVIEYGDFSASRKLFGKAVFDFFVSLLALAALAPVFAVIAAAVRLEGPGPVFYKSRRYGRRGRIFKMYKFRSMVRGADELYERLKNRNEVDGPIFKIRDDPRVTRVGKFLRKYSLDELPQLFNVLRGDMSLVGPRPLPIDQIEKEDLKQLRRLEVRPGITGLWQIRGRSDLSFARLVRWDIWYISNWSMWLDITILIQTIPAVIKGKGAY